MSVDTLGIISNSAAQTRKIGMKLGELALPGDLFLLVGQLGAGKTCLTQGIAQGLGVSEYTSSPSFVLAREYQGRFPLYHIDLYRLERAEEIAQLGLDDYIYGGGVCVVEWADRDLRAFPEEHMLVEMEYLSATRRRLAFHAAGMRYEGIVSELKARKRARR